MADVAPLTTDILSLAGEGNITLREYALPNEALAGDQRQSLTEWLRMHRRTAGVDGEYSETDNLQTLGLSFGPDGSIRASHFGMVWARGEILSYRRTQTRPWPQCRNLHAA
jgi:hypothetical protein